MTYICLHDSSHWCKMVQVPPPAADALVPYIYHKPNRSLSYKLAKGKTELSTGSHLVL